MDRITLKQSALKETYGEASKFIGRCYDADELLELFQFFAPAIVWLETGTTKESPLSVNDDKAIHEKCQRLLVIAAAMHIDEEDLDYLRNLAVWLSDNGFAKLSNFIELFLLTFHQFIENPPPDSHCYFDVVPLKCKECGFTSEFLFWNVINTRLREDLRRLTSSGEVFKHRCPYCGHTESRCGTLFYCDPSRDDYFLLVPPSSRTQIEAAEAGTSKYLEDLDQEFRGQKSSVAFVSRYVPAPWQNAENVNIVSHLQNPRELMDIINAPLNLDCLIYSDQTVFDPSYMNADEEFRNKNYEKAITLYAQAFLRDQKQVPFLFNICAALHNLGKVEKAALLKRRTNALRLKLRESGVIFDSRGNWPLPQTAEGSSLSLQIDNNGLPAEWDFEDILITVKSFATDGQETPGWEKQ